MNHKEKRSKFSRRDSTKKKQGGEEELAADYRMKDEDQQQEELRASLGEKKVALWIHVRNLPLEWGETDLIKFFSNYGGILSVRLLRHYERFTGTALVKFASLTEAQSTIHQLNYKNHESLPRPLLLKWLDSEELRLGVGERGDHRLFVGSLPRQAKRESIYELFSVVGEVQAVTLEEKQFWAMVSFRRKESAILAIRHLDGQAYMHGSRIPIEVRFKQRRYNSFMTVKKQALEDKSDPLEYIPDSGLYRQAIRDDRKQFCQLSTGRWFDVAPPRARVFGLQRNYIVKGVVEQKRAIGRKVGPVGSNLFISNLVDSVKEDHLREAFSVFGNIISISISTDQRGKMKGMGFVSYDSPESAALAIAEMDGCQLQGCRLRVELNSRDKSFISKSKPVLTLADAHFDF